MLCAYEMLAVELIAPRMVCGPPFQACFSEAALVEEDTLAPDPRRFLDQKPRDRKVHMTLIWF